MVMATSSRAFSTLCGGVGGTRRPRHRALDAQPDAPRLGRPDRRAPRLPYRVATTPGDYIVTLAAAPVAAYDGDVKGFEATRPADGRRVDVTSTKPSATALPARQQDKVAARVGAKPRSRFEIGLTAFTANLTTPQAKTLARTDGVVSVTKNMLRSATDDRNSVDYLGLSGYDGVWSTLGGTKKAGRGVVVGVIDSGIWPESASVAGPPWELTEWQVRPVRKGNRIIMTKSDGGTFSGVCQTGDDFTADDCTTKLVGARYFGEAWLKQQGPTAEDFESPARRRRPRHPHGLHRGRQPRRPGRGRRSRLRQDLRGGTSSQDRRLQGAVEGQDRRLRVRPLTSCRRIDSAIADGVDVINYSISDDDDPTDPVQLAFLSAASAGIFVAASAGNSGPGASTMQHTSPWVTTVGASTVRPYYGTVTLGNGQKYAGISHLRDHPGRSGAAGQRFGLAASGAATAADGNALRPGSLDPAKTAGKIVVCDRGVVRSGRQVRGSEAGGWHRHGAGQPD